MGRNAADRSGTLAPAARFRVPPRLLQKHPLRAMSSSPREHVSALLFEWVQSITSTATQIFSVL